ncbi:phosphoribosylformylglycinamidine synthase subunit PurQ [Marinibaculum pumilum]|uniref:Phosphoribosylformylglycinamidine synthase subunit PurQ n=1 Tax=Marinibaculum pumilum TaxID=1766165 RepID=A0ABV7L4P8_9PROT
MKAGVIVFPASNCDRDVAVALEQSTGRPTTMVWHGETQLPALDLIVVPGGFSYGDYLRCGAIAAHSPIMREVVARARAGTPVLAICNGFQIVQEAGLLPGALLRNASQRFVCRDVHLKVERSTAPFTSRYNAGTVIRIPVAHHDGNFYADDETLAELQGEGRVVFRYVTAEGARGPAANPNGSLDDIAGICDPSGRILGMMPHPERLADAMLGGADGRAMFDAAVEHLS